MDAVINNPYRILGILVGASAAVQRKQMTRLLMFLEAEQETEPDFSFQVLDPLVRTTNTVNNASSKLNLDSDRMLAALFWFYSGNAITDEAAFEALKDSNLGQATSIWTKLVSSNEVTQRNASAFNNLSTVLLSQGLKRNKIGSYTFDWPKLEHGITLKLKFLESEFCKDLKTLATDETYKTTKKELQNLFLNHVGYEIEKNYGGFSSKFLDILIKIEFLSKEDIIKGLLRKLVGVIEKFIEESKKKRVADESLGIELAKKLVSDTKTHFQQLRLILNKSDLQLAAISDKLAMEIFACGRDYFELYKESDIDPGKSVMELFEMAQKLAIGKIAKQQIQENIEGLQTWIEQKPIRDKLLPILGDIEIIDELCEEFEDQPKTLENINNFIDECSYPLVKILLHLNIGDEFYTNISSRIAMEAQKSLVDFVNAAQMKIRYKEDLDNFRILLNAALKITDKIDKFIVRPEIKQHILTNKNALIQIEQQVFNRTAGAFEKIGRSLGNFFKK